VVRLSYDPPQWNEHRRSVRFHAKVEVDSDETLRALTRASSDTFRITSIVHKSKERKKPHGGQEGARVLSARITSAFSKSAGGRVRLSKHGVSDKDLDLIVEKAQAMEELRLLDLRHNEISNVGAAQLVQLAERCSSLIRIDIEGNPVERHWHGALEGKTAANALQCKSASWDPLRGLCGRPLGDMGASTVAKVIESPRGPLLPVLGIAKAGIGATGAHAISTAMLSGSPTARSIKLLEVYSNATTGAWAEAFAPVIKNSETLESLDLGGNGIDDAGCALLAQALKHSTLCELHLDYNKISDTGASLLLEAVPSSRLHTLWVHGNLVSLTAMRRLASSVALNRERLMPRPTESDIRDALWKRVQTIDTSFADDAPENMATLGSETACKAKLNEKLASAAIESYEEQCPSHAASATGQVVVASILMCKNNESVRSIALGVGTRFVDSLLFLGGPEDNERVKDSHAEVIARRCFVRFLLAHVALFDQGSPRSIFTVALDEEELLSLKPGLSFHLYTSVAPCGTASSAGLALGQFYRKGGGQTCTPWEPGYRKSCTDKILRWCANGLQGKSLLARIQPVTLDSVVVGRRWSQRCAQVLPCSSGTTLLPSQELRDDGNKRGDSDLCVAWTLGEKAELYDGKTGLHIDTRPTRISRWWMGQEAHTVLARAVEWSKEATSKSTNG